jgi:excisionase family DNA binding protein
MNPFIDPMPLMSPTESDKAKAATCIRTMAASHGSLRLTLELDDHTVTELDLPAVAVTLLQSILSEVARGNAVTALPVMTELTTRQAAELLNVSRPYLIGLLERAIIPHHRVGSHRRVKLQDILNYKKLGDIERDKVMDELVSLGQELNTED